MKQYQVIGVPDQDRLFLVFPVAFALDDFLHSMKSYIGE